jgi:hypothetical protein
MRWGVAPERGAGTVLPRGCPRGAGAVAPWTGRQARPTIVSMSSLAGFAGYVAAGGGGLLATDATGLGLVVRRGGAAVLDAAIDG